MMKPHCEDRRLERAMKIWRSLTHSCVAEMWFCLDYKANRVSCELVASEDELLNDLYSDLAVMVAVAVRLVVSSSSSVR